MAIHSLTKEDSGRTVHATVGDLLSVELDSNATTGFDWDFHALDESLFDVMENNFSIAENAAIGAGGMRIFKIKVIKAGKGQIKLKYRQSWEEDKSVRHWFTLIVEAI